MSDTHLIRPARPAEAERLSVDVKYVGKHPVIVIEHEAGPAGFPGGCCPCSTFF